MVKVAVESHFDHYSRFEVIVMCGGFSVEGDKLYVEGIYKEEGATRVELATSEAHHIEARIYFIPKFLPGSKNNPILDYPPFEATITIENQSGVVHNRVHSVNGWGGTAVKLDYELKR